ncbi:peptide methionine sulfoxide reductase MsrB [Anabrus simplex]|uniref:peptide methionine sulfoxide reductase MsrB n=1 Tax=Anabrus simplex TaxID=316456 RepID=UPI0035A32B81
MGNTRLTYLSTYKYHQTEPGSNLGADLTSKEDILKDNLNLTDAEWAKQLSPEAYKVCRKSGTERPGSGIYNKHFLPGVYNCSSCGNELFRSEMKFDSGTGWPSFYAAINNSVEEHEDLSHGMKRVEVKCSKCGAHLGHVFKDGPKPTGLRYCINSVCLEFIPNEEV